MEIQINNDILDDEYIILDLQDFYEDFKELEKILSKGIMNTNIEALGKMKQFAESCGIEIKD